MSQEFPKSQRLSSRKAIEELFKENNRIVEQTISCVWVCKEAHDSNGLKAAFSAPKKQFKKAVDRNLLKRRMREAFRLNKSEIEDQLIGRNMVLHIMFIFTGREIEDFKEIEGKIILILRRLTLMNE